MDRRREHVAMVFGTHADGPRVAAHLIVALVLLYNSGVYSNTSAHGRSVSGLLLRPCEDCPHGRALVTDRMSLHVA